MHHWAWRGRTNIERPCWCGADVAATKDESEEGGGVPESWTPGSIAGVVGPVAHCGLGGEVFGLVLEFGAQEPGFAGCGGEGEDGGVIGQAVGVGVEGQDLVRVCGFVDTWLERVRPGWRSGGDFRPWTKMGPGVVGQEETRMETAVWLRWSRSRKGSKAGRRRRSSRRRLR